MNQRRARTAPAIGTAIESLEGRIALSGAAQALHPAGNLPDRAVEVAARNSGGDATRTIVNASPGTLAQPITFTVTVRASATAGSPQGTVELVDRGTVFQTLTLVPEPSTDARFAYSDATFTFAAEPGGGAFYFGRHPVTADYLPSGAFLKSTGRTSFTVPQPEYTKLSGGVKIATVTPGSGPGVESGQTASVLYTGYLARNGHIFDDSVNDGGSPISFAVGEGQVIEGFDEGMVGMQVGQTRIIWIPPAEGYGRTANGPIPGNSTLVFVVTLVSIS